MKAMILAAGRGERLKPLTDTTPKPLLQVGKYKLIEYHLLALKNAGINEIVINVSYHAQQIIHALGDGQHYGVSINYSFEPTALETGGGICQALSLLGDEAFLVVNSDILTDYPLAQLIKTPAAWVHLVLVDNRSQDHLHGDFYFPATGSSDDIYLPEYSEKKLTFSGIGVYKPQLFKQCRQGKFPLRDLLQQAISKQQITGEHYRGFWLDVGTPERFAEALQIQRRGIFPKAVDTTQRR